MTLSYAFFNDFYTDINGIRAAIKSNCTNCLKTTDIHCSWNSVEDVLKSGSFMPVCRNCVQCKYYLLTHESFNVVVRFAKHLYVCDLIPLKKKPDGTYTGYFNHIIDEYQHTIIKSDSWTFTPNNLRYRKAVSVHGPKTNSIPALQYLDISSTLTLPPLNKKKSENESMDENQEKLS